MGFRIDIQVDDYNISVYITSGKPLIKVDNFDVPGNFYIKKLISLYYL